MPACSFEPCILGTQLWVFLLPRLMASSLASTNTALDLNMPHSVRYKDNYPRLTA